MHRWWAEGRLDGQERCDKPRRARTRIVAVHRRDGTRIDCLQLLHQACTAHVVAVEDDGFLAEELGREDARLPVVVRPQPYDVAALGQRRQPARRKQQRQAQRGRQRRDREYGLLVGVRTHDEAHARAVAPEKKFLDKRRVHILARIDGRQLKRPLSTRSGELSINVHLGLLRRPHLLVRGARIAEATTAVLRAGLSAEHQADTDGSGCGDAEEYKGY